MKTRLGIMGASGKMGRSLIALIEESNSWDDFEISYKCSPTMGSLDAMDPSRVDVWIDFSQPQGTLGLLKIAASPVVIATTGFTESQSSEIRKYSEKHSVVFAANTSLGVFQLKRLLKSISPLSGFDVVVSEEHHKNKVDAPSGTAKEISRVLEANDIAHLPIQSIRAGGLCGTHTVKFVSAFESLELKHTAFHRSVFAEGALKAARFLTTKAGKSGFYSMDDVYSPGKEN